jgi:hypothetical protein
MHRDNTGDGRISVMLAAVTARIRGDLPVIEGIAPQPFARFSR